MKNARMTVLVLGMVWLVHCPRVHAQVMSEADRAILQELRQIRAVLMEIRGEIEQLKQDKGANAAAAAQPFFPGGFHSRGPDAAKLSKIKLPADPSDDQVKDYIRDIMTVSKGQNSFSSQDPQVGMLVKLGPDRVELLLESLARRPGHGFAMGYFHVRQAVLKLVTDEHKELVLKALPAHTFLAEAVLERGWERDAREVLIEELSSADPQQLPIEWIQSVANLGDPETYDKLKWYLIQRENRYATYGAIRDLPGLDLTDAVEKIWTKTGYNEWEERGIAKMAMQYGHLDAVERLLEYLDGENRGQWETREIRRLLFQHVDFRGSNKDVQEWINKNRENIVFDKERKKFVLGKKD